MAEFPTDFEGNLLLMRGSPPGLRLAARAEARELLLAARQIVIQAERILEAAPHDPAKVGRAEAEQDRYIAGALKTSRSTLSELIGRTHDGENEVFACPR